MKHRQYAKTGRHGIERISRLLAAVSVIGRMKSSIMPVGQVPKELVHAYLVQSGMGRGLRPAEVQWKYYDEEFNQGRERGYVWFKDGRVRGFIGWMPVTVATPAGDRDMVWTCDWSVDDPNGNPGIGILLLSKVQKNYGFVGGVGGSADTHSTVPRMRTNTVAGIAVRLRRPLRLASLLERAEDKLPALPRLSATALGRVKLPRRSAGGAPAAVFSDGVDAAALGPLFDQPAVDHCRVRYNADHLAWLGRYPEADFRTGVLKAGTGFAAALLWRRHWAADRWRMVIRCNPDGTSLVGPLVGQVLERLADTTGNIVSTIASSHDHSVLEQLKRHGFIQSAERLPLYIPDDDGAGGCREGFSQMSYLDTDLAFND